MSKVRGYADLTDAEHTKLALAGGRIYRLKVGGDPSYTIEPLSGEGVHEAVSLTNHWFNTPRQAYEAFWPRYKEWVRRNEL